MEQFDSNEDVWNNNPHNVGTGIHNVRKKFYFN